MNTKSPKEISRIKRKFQSLFAEKRGEEKIEQEALMLMTGFLSEIEAFQTLSDKFNKRKDLAKAIGTSASYLTQVFRGDRPLNFQTIAKIQDVLGIHFEITAKRFIKPEPDLKSNSKPRIRRTEAGKKGRLSKKRNPVLS